MRNKTRTLALSNMFELEIRIYCTVKRESFKPVCFNECVKKSDHVIENFAFSVII